MVAALGTAGVSAEGVYPGGQSENPASPWYASLVRLGRDPAPRRRSGAAGDLGRQADEVGGVVAGPAVDR
jgi:hypothetical protein